MKKLMVLPLVFISGFLLAQGNKKFCEQITRLGDMASHDSLSSLQGKMIKDSDTEFESTFKLSGAVSGRITLSEFGDNPTAAFLMKSYGTDSAKAVNEFEKMAQRVQDCLPAGIKIEDVMKVAGNPQTKRFFYYKKAMIIVETYKIYRTGQWVSDITAYRR